MTGKRKQQAAVGGNEPMATPAATFAAEVASMLTSCNERLLDLHREATQIAFTEAANVQAAWLRATTATLDLLPSQGDRASAMRTFEIVSAWLQVLGQTQASLLQLLGQTATHGDLAVMPRRPAAWAGTVDRRRMAVVINFPDRRHAA